MKPKLLALLASFVLMESAHAVAAIGWANTQWPVKTTYTAGGGGTDSIYGRVWIDGVTNAPGATSGLMAWVGFGTGLDPTSWTNWEAASFNFQVGDYDEFVGKLDPQYGGTYNYAYRYNYMGGSYVYTDLIGPVFGNLTLPGVLTV